MAGRSHMSSVSLSPQGRERKEQRISCNFPTLGTRVGGCTIYQDREAQIRGSKIWSPGQDMLGLGSRFHSAQQVLLSILFWEQSPILAGLQSETQLTPLLASGVGHDPDLTDERTSFS